MPEPIGPNPEQSEKQFKLEGFLQEPRKDYKRLIAKNDESSELWNRDKWPKDSLFARFGKTLESLYDNKNVSLEKESAWRDIETRVKGGILLDLGAGHIGLDNLASKLGAKTYIRIDKFWPEKDENENAIELDSLKDLSVGKLVGKTQVVTIKADMLDVLSRFPDNSVSAVMLNGIDASIIKDLKYSITVIFEISRILKPNGIVFGYSLGNIIDDIKNEDGSSAIKNLKFIESKITEHGFRVLEKIKNN